MTNPKDETQRTHWEGCWKTYGHHDCAVERVAELEAEIEARGPVAVTRRVDLTVEALQAQLAERDARIAAEQQAHAVTCEELRKAYAALLTPTNDVLSFPSPEDSAAYSEAFSAAEKYLAREEQRKKETK